MPPQQPTYAGYGLPDARTLTDRFPVTSNKDAIEDARKILSDTLLTIEPSAWIAPPFKSKYYTDSRRTILNIDAAVDAAANAAGLAIQTAETQFVALNPAISTTTGAGTGQFFTLWSKAVPNGHLMVIESWGVQCVNAPPEAVAVRIPGGVGTIGGLASPPNPAVSDEQVVNHQKTKYIVGPDETFVVEMGNVVNTTPLFVVFSVGYWTFPVTRFVGKKEQAKNVPGYGVVGCQPNTGTECR